MQDERYYNALNKCSEYGQEHLLRFYDQLNEQERDSLISQIENIDFKQMEELYRQAVSDEDIEDLTGRISPINVYVKDRLPGAEVKQCCAIGRELMRSGRYAVVTMAGGQGTRLGHKGPKGTYDLGLKDFRSLFEIQASRLLKKHEELDVYIPWYIMTSRENNAATKAFFEANDYFGYDKDSIIFFTQCMLPMIHADSGKIVLSEKGKIKEGADGHGGIFRAMAMSGVFDDMTARNIKWIFVCGIDNVLVRVCDPLLPGFMETTGNQVGGKSLIKSGPGEKVGVFCKKDGKPYVIEYTEISDEMASATDEEGDYIYGDGHILENIFSLDAMKKLAEAGLSYHKAFKKTEYVDESGDVITPEGPNAFKFEAFIFDAFNFFNDMSILRVSREREFAPVKNKEGEDSPDTARAMFTACGEDIY